MRKKDYLLKEKHSLPIKKNHFFKNMNYIPIFWILSTYCNGKFSMCILQIIATKFNSHKMKNESGRLPKNEYLNIHIIFMIYKL